jgi:glycerol uptake facilitator protein
MLPKTKGSGIGYFMVVTGWAFGIALAVFLFARASGAHLNPVISLALAMFGLFPWEHVIPYTIAQCLGCATGAVIVYLLYVPYFRESQDTIANRGVFCTFPGIRSKFWSFMAEMIATGFLLFVITGLGYAARDGEKVLFDPGFSALAIGLLILTIGLAMGGPTGFAMNPARDLFPRIVYIFLPMPAKGDPDWGYAWVPIVAPIIGAPIGCLCWRLLFGDVTIPALIFS